MWPKSGDAAYVDIAQGLRGVIDAWRSSKK
jgi:hypothetical protein